MSTCSNVSDISGVMSERDPDELSGDEHYLEELIWAEKEDELEGNDLLQDVSEGVSPPSTGVPNVCDDEYGLFYDGDRDEQFSYSATYSSIESGGSSSVPSDDNFGF